MFQTMKSRKADICCFDQKQTFQSECKIDYLYDRVEQKYGTLRILAFRLAANFHAPACL